VARYDFEVVIVERQKGRQVAPPQGLQRPTRNLHVLLRHRLLRELGSFEGFLAVAEGLTPDKLAFPHSPEFTDPDRKLVTAAGLPAPHGDERDHVIAVREELSGSTTVSSNGASMSSHSRRKRSWPR
jgi:hypothetical protein